VSNPNQHSLPIFVNVILEDSQEKFDFEKLLRQGYKFEVIGGQHICQADHEILEAKYTSETLKNAPNTLVYKNVEICLNLSKEEKALLVTVDNNRIHRSESNVDKVLLNYFLSVIILFFFIFFSA
jgi:hypothetical protein